MAHPKLPQLSSGESGQQGQEVVVVIDPRQILKTLSVIRASVTETTARTTISGKIRETYA